MASMKGILAAGALGLAVATPAAQAQDIIIGTGVDPTFSPLYVGVEAGIFERLGVAVDLKLFSSGSAAVDPMISGEVNVAMTGPARPLLTHVRAPKVTVVAQFVTQKGYTDLIGLQSIGSVEELRGQRVGYELGTTTEVFALEILAQYDMGPGDISHVNLQPPEALAALQNRNIEAVFSFKPWSDRAVEALPDTLHMIPGAENFFSHLHIFADREWAEASEANMEALIKFLAGIREAAEVIDSDKDAAAEMVARHLRMDIAAVRPLLDLNAYTLVFNEETMALLQREVEFQIRSGRLDPGFEYGPFVFTEPLAHLDADLVSYALPD